MEELKELALQFKLLISGLALVIAGAVWSYGGLLNILAVGNEAKIRQSKEIMSHVIRGLILIASGPWILPLIWRLLKWLFA